MTNLGRYQIFEQLGTGSMGTVYRAHDTILEREVALKTIRTEGEIDPELRERFYREARACARLQHPSIVVIHDLGEIDRVAYIAMEMLEGADFRRLIEQRMEIPVAAKLDMMAQICDALSYAHRRGIIHRDVKPSNLFAIDNKRAKVLDFGIARLPSSRLTQEGKVLGTPNYMAPEQILGKPADGRSDLFSAAVVFFEFLANVHPFQAENIPPRIVDDTPDPLAASQRKLPVLLERVFARGLAKEPERRYQTGDEFAADLRAISDRILQNASPSFARAPLPSERSLSSRAEQRTEDLYEDRLSELMQLIPEFEGAIAQGDIALAKQIMVRLEAIAAADSRCAEPVRLCRKRLADLPPAAGSDGPGRQMETASNGPNSKISGVGDPGTGVKTCKSCGCENRLAAVYCIQCGANLPRGGTAPAKPAAPVVQTQIDPGGTCLFRPDMEEVQHGERGDDIEHTSNANAVPDAPEPSALAPRAEELSPEPKATDNRWRSIVEYVLKQRQVALLAVGLMAAIVMMIIIAVAFQPIRLETPVAAIAQVARPAFIYAAKDTKSKSKPVPNGEVINVLLMPQKPEQAWVRVQWVRQRKAQMRPAYMHATDLSKWSSNIPVNQLAIMLHFEEQPRTESEVQEELERLRVSIGHAAGTPESLEAYIYMARLELFLAQVMKKNSRSEVDWLPHVRAAQKDLENGKGGGDESEYEQQIAEILPKEPSIPPVTPPPPVPPISKPKKSIDALLKDADGLINEGRRLNPDEQKPELELAKLKEAENIIQQILSRSPDNLGALKIQKRIKTRMDFVAR